MAYINSDGYRLLSREPGKSDLAHRRKVEEILGKKLPVKSVIHHIDENRDNNKNDNLVVCPDESYHRLLHARQAAIDLGLPAHYKRCGYCKQYGDSSTMGRRGFQEQYWHRECRNKAIRAKRWANK